jgi:hypothetical protein
MIEVSGLRLIGAVDIPMFSRAVDDVVRRHATLRTSFELLAGAPVQIIGPAKEGFLEHVELASELSPASRDAASERLQQLVQPFALDRRPVARLLLLSLGSEEHWFATGLHRILLDAINGQELLRDVMRTYAAFLAGTPAPATPEVQYADYTVWQRKRLEMPAVQERLKSYRARFEGAQALALPYDRPRPTPRRAEVHPGPFTIARETWSGIQELARKESTTSFVVAAAAFKAFLAGITGQKDITILAPSQLARGVAPQLSTMLGPFASFLLLRSKYAGAPTLRELVNQERAVVADAGANADLPASLVLEHDCPWDSPLGGGLLNFLPAGAVANWPAIGELQMEPLEPPPNKARRRSDLIWICTDNESGSRIVGAADVFDKATIADLSKRFAAFLAARVAAPDSPAVE